MKQLISIASREEIFVTQKGIGFVSKVQIRRILPSKEEGMIAASSTHVKKKKKFIILPSELSERHLPVLLCEHDGIRCLYLFVKAREDQPTICFHCLQDLVELNPIYADYLRAYKFQKYRL